MAASILGAGPINWDGDVDVEGYRTYHATYQVLTLVNDGPYIAMNCAGLPYPGSVWQIGNDLDPFVWCLFTRNARPRNQQEANVIWDVQVTFTNKPPDGRRNRCTDHPITDPLLEPARLSGSFSKYSEEATIDRFGQAIVSSSWERLRGPQVEFDATRISFRVEMNTAQLFLALVGSMVNTVNAFDLYGLPPRCIKLSSASWQRLFYGQCYVYYKWVFEFEANYKKDAYGNIYSGFDRDLDDEGTRVLNGHWLPNDGTGQADYVVDKLGGVVIPNKDNPAHYIAYKDRYGASGPVLLNGAGLPAFAGIRMGPSLFISRVARNGTGKHFKWDLGDPKNWTQLATNPAAPPTWSAGRWGYGALVKMVCSGTTPANSTIYFLCTNSLGTKGTPDTGGRTVGDWESYKPSGSTAVDSASNAIPTLNNLSDTISATYNPATTYVAGDYVSADTGIGPYFMSLVDAQKHTNYDLVADAVMAKRGIKGNDPKTGFTRDNWVFLKTSPFNPPIWEACKNYEFGTLVFYRDPADDTTRSGIYIQLNINGSQNANGKGIGLQGNSAEPSRNDPNNSWSNLTNLLTTSSDKGAYVGLNDGVNGIYNTADFVTLRALAGRRHVEKYDGSDFTLLGLPLVLE